MMTIVCRLPSITILPRLMAVAVLFGGPALADEEPSAAPIVGGDAYHTWTDATGAHQTVAALVSLEDGVVTLKRRDNHQEVRVPIQRLCEEDQRLLTALSSLNRTERPSRAAKIAIKGVGDLHKQLLSLALVATGPQQVGETDVEASARKAIAREKLVNASVGRKLTLYARVENVQQAVVRHDAFEEIFMSLETSADRKKRSRREAEVHDVTLSWLEYPFAIDSEIRLRNSSIRKVKVGDYLEIKGSLGLTKNAIGIFYLRMPGTSFKAAFSVASAKRASSALALLLSSMEHVEEADGPTLNVQTISRAEFRQAFLRMDGSSALTESFVRRDDLAAMFGEPVDRSSVGTESFWAFRCSDGLVVLRVNNQVDGNIAMTERVPELMSQDVRIMVTAIIDLE